jgi:beta-1,4-mannosyltransferase
MTATAPTAPTSSGRPEGEDGRRPLVVLQSFPTPRPTTNPYLVMLRASLEELGGVEVRTFTWRTALLGRYDVFHAHWPEILVSGASPLKAAVRQVLFLLFLLRLRLSRIPLVRTMHNLDLPSGISRQEVALLRLAERGTTLRLLLNPVTTLPGGQRAHRILHGSYQDWFARHARSMPRPGHLVYVGLIRRYKGVEALVAAFRETALSAPDLTLTVAGKPSTEELAASMRAAVEGDDRIALSLAFLDDAELCAAITAGEMVVLPYREMHNSGMTVAALSLDRPVLVPDNEVNRRLSAEVGPGWVHLFHGDLTGQRLQEALAELRAAPPMEPPDLSAREWDDAGRAHLAAYREAVRLARS